MKFCLVIIVSAAALFGQNKTKEEDSYFVEDTIIQSPTKISDTAIHSSRPAADTNIQKSSTAKKNIMIFGEISCGYVWHQYDEPLFIWEYSDRFGYGLSSGIALNLMKPFRIRAGIRFFRSGNKMNLTYGYYDVNYDIITGDPIDSEYVQLRGYFKLTQYYLSAPINVDIFLKDIPIYIFTGVETSYLISASSIVEYSLNSEKFKETANNEKKLYRPINVSLTHGIGIQFKMFKKLTSEIQLVFSWGLLPMNKPDDWATNFQTREFSLRYMMIF